MKKLSIRIKITLGTALLLIAGFALLVSASVQSVRESVTNSMKNQFVNETKQIAEQVKVILAITNEENEVQALQDFVDTLVADYKHVAYAITIDDTVTAIAHSDHIKIGKNYGLEGVEAATALREEIYIGEFWADVQQSWTYDVIVPVYDGGVLWGAMNIGIYCSEIDTIVDELGTAMIFISLLVLLAVVAAEFIIFFISFRPLDEIQEVCSKMEQGDFTASISDKNLKRFDEIGKIAHALNTTRIKLSDLIYETVKHTEKLILITDGVHEITTNTQEMSAAISERAGETVEGCLKQEELTVTNVNMTEDITKGMEEISVNISTVSNTANATAEEAKKGNEKLDIVVNQMSDIESKVRATAEKIHELNQMSNSIQTVVELISDISSQTNLLALNASIEAARAGEHGKGFAVVANEVSQLADQSKKAADEIGSIITEIQASIGQCVKQMEAGAQSVEIGIAQSSEAKETFNEILQHINKVSDEMTNVSAIAEEINGGSSRLLDSIVSIKDISSTVTQKTEDGLKAADEQKQMMLKVIEQVDELKEISSEIKVAVNAFVIE